MAWQLLLVVVAAIIPVAAVKHRMHKLARRSFEQTGSIAQPSPSSPSCAAGSRGEWGPCDVKLVKLVKGYIYIYTATLLYLQCLSLKVSILGPSP
ncbi:hypothetical protein HDV63DRAFT_231759 [Trichoderma sp. SZMC 28014]